MQEGRAMRSAGSVTVRAVTSPLSPVALQKAVENMVDFFDGFEYGETAIVMTHGDYMQHWQAFHTGADSPSGLSLCGIPVYLNGMVNNGQLLLTSIHEAEKIIAPEQE